MVRRHCAWLLVLVVSCGGEQVLGELDGAARDGQAPSCDEAFGRRIRVEIDARPFTQPLDDFPVLVRLTPESLVYSGAGPRGEGIRFTDEECTSLAHEVETWDAAGESSIWVRASISPGSLQSIFLFFDEDVPEDRSSPGEVYEESFVAVYHLESGDLSDASARRQRGSNNGSTEVAGVVGAGRALAEGQTISIPDASFSDGLGGRTACMWARSDDDGAAYYYLFAHGEGEDPVGGFALNRHGDIFECVGGDGSKTRLDGVFPAGDRDWRYVCCSYDGAEAAIYSNGVVAQREEQSWPLALDVGRIGGPVTRSGSHGSWRGDLDEVRISGVARSAEWIAAEYASMTGALVTLAAPEQTGR